MGVRVMVFNTTFNNNSVILWQSVLLMEESEENYRPAASHGQRFSYIVVLSTPCHERDSNLFFCVDNGYSLFGDSENRENNS